MAVRRVSSGLVLCGVLLLSCAACDDDRGALDDDDTRVDASDALVDGDVECVECAEPWARTFGDEAFVLDLDWSTVQVEVGRDGRVVLAGSFGGSADFGSGAMTRSGDDRDLFVAAFARDGSPLWSRSFGAEPGGSAVSDLALDGEDNVVLTGRFFSETLDLGGGALSGGAYVAKLAAADGAHLWSVAPGGATAGADPRAVAVDRRDGHVLVAGSFNGTIQFEGEAVSAPSGWSKDFLVELDASGAPVWSDIFGYGIELQQGDLAVAADGSIALCGWAGRDDLGLGDAPIEAAELPTQFVVGLAADGEVRFARGLAVEQMSATRVAFAADGTLYVAGGFHESLTLGGATLSSPGGTSAYVMALGADGVPQWGSMVGGLGSIEPTVLSTDLQGGPVLGARYDGLLEFAGGRHGGPEVFGGFAAGFAASGAAQWIEASEGCGTLAVLDVAVDPLDGSAVVAGWLEGEVSLAELRSTDAARRLFVARLAVR